MTHVRTNTDFDRLLGLITLLGVMAASSICGCADRNFESLKAGIESRGHYIDGVPFTYQNEYACGPAALKSILLFWGNHVELEAITRKIYVPALRGTLPMDMENFARESGFEAASRSGSLDELKAHIRSGIPVICMLDLGFGIYRKPHYITVIGFDDVHTVIIGHDGVKPNTVIPYDSFYGKWTRAGRWMLVIKPKSGEAGNVP